MNRFKYLENKIEKIKWCDRCLRSLPHPKWLCIELRSAWTPKHLLHQEEWVVKDFNEDLVFLYLRGSTVAISILAFSEQWRPFKYE